MPISKRNYGAYLLALQTAANQVQSIPAKTANILFKAQADYDAFVLPEDSSVVIHAIEAAKTIGLSPSLELGKGGLDSNWIVKHGVPSLTFGAGQHEIHTLNEYVDLREFHEDATLHSPLQHIYQKLDLNRFILVPE